jgi:hypothetical protein
MTWFLIRPVSCAGLARHAFFVRPWIAELDPAMTDHSPKLTLSRGSSTVKPVHLIGSQADETVVVRHIASSCVNSSGVITRAAQLRRWSALGEMT